MRGWVLAAGLVSWLAWACATGPATIEDDFRSPVALARVADEAREWAVQVGQLRDLHAEAWSCLADDPGVCSDAGAAAELITELYTDDAILDDPMFGDMARGSAELRALFRQRLSDRRVLFAAPAVALFLGRDQAAVVEKTRNVFGLAAVRVLGVYQFRDGRVTNVAYYYPVASLRAHLYFSTPEADVARKLTSSYVTAWSSGNPELVAALYAPETIVTDALVDEVVTGSAQLETSADRLIAGLPQLSFSAGMSYVGSRLSEVVASQYTVSYRQEGETCRIRALSTFDMSSGLINRETIYYDPDTLSCDEPAALP